MIRNNAYLLLFLIIGIIAACGTSGETQSRDKDGDKEEKEVRNLQLDDTGQGLMGGNEGKSSKARFYDAMKQKLIGNNEKAIELFEKVIKADENLASAYYHIADIHEEEKNYEEASYYAGKAAELQPDNKHYQLLHAEILTYYQKYDKAADILEEQLSKDVADRELYLKLAMIYEMQGERQKAIDTYDRFENIAGVNEQISMAKKSLYLKMDNIKAAVREVEKLIDEYPAEMRYYHMLAEVYRANNMEDEALKVYRQMLDMDAGNPLAAFSLAQHYLQKDKQAEFEEYMEIAFKAQDLELENKVQFLMSYVKRYPAEGEEGSFAMKLSDWLIEAHEDSAVPYAARAQLLQRQGRSEEALEMFEQSLQRDESNFAIWQDAMLLAARQEKYDRLERLASDAAAVFPNQPFPYYMRGLAFAMQDKNEQAEQAYKQSLLIGSSNAELKSEVYSQLGDLYHKMEKHALSDSMYDESLSINPSNPYVLNNYAYYLSLRNEKLEKAEEMARKANQIEPRNSSFEDTYGWVLYQLDKYEEAAEWLQRAMNHGGSSSATILEHFGDVQYKLGSKEKALEYWQKAKENGDSSELLEKKISERKLYE